MALLGGLSLLFNSLAVVAGDSETIGLDALRRERPAITGAGIPVAQPEGDGGGGSWQVDPMYNVNTAFTWISALGTATNFPNSVGTVSGHANGVALYFYGTGPYGVAQGVPTVDSYEALYFITNVIVPGTGIRGQVVNQSFLVPSDSVSFYDAFAVDYNVLIVSGVNNIPDTPVGAYNGLSVGIFSDTAQSSVGPTSDGRAKPDLVAPHFCCSSFSTPQVAGAGALLLQAAAQDDAGAGTSAIATNASVIKALLLNGAVKMTNWTNGVRRPLDARYGAGLLNIYNSDLQLRGGRHVALVTNSVPLNGAHPPVTGTNNVAVWRGWDFARLQSAGNNDRVAHYFFDLPAHAGAHSATATLAWKKGSGSLTNLELFLYETTSNTLVTCSTSTVDNVEHLFVPSLPAGRYDLQVLLRGGAGTRSETYALAFDFSPTRLQLRSVGTNVTVIWPASPAGFRLQAAAGLENPISWQDMAPTNAILSNGFNTATMPVVPARRFFRLFRP